MQKPIYLDYMATTPIDERVISKMLSCMSLNGDFGNAASTTHSYGWQANQLVEEARGQVAELICANSNEIIWTSGATESNNLAIKGAAFFYERKGKHIITSKIEHKSVLDCTRYLEEKGFTVTYLSPDAQGMLSLDEIQQAIRPDTILISIMHVNNEIGVIQNLAKIGVLAKSNGVVFHVDAAQSFGKVPIDVNLLQVDLMSFSAHKIYGPKGVGALYVRRKPRIRLSPLIHGGGHELGLRSGTLPTHQIVGMGEASKIAQQEMTTENIRIRHLRDKLWTGICGLGHLFLNGDLDNRVAGNLNVSFDFIEGESLLLALKLLAVSSGSACNSATIEPSYVLRAIGCRNELANSAIRFSIGRFTTEEEIDCVIKEVNRVVSKLREISPLPLPPSSFLLGA
jgi:cysteine desulfurase